MDIFIPIVIVAGIGLIAGIILALASTIMAVPKDERVEALEVALPGANCGACGYSGCSGYAEALAKGEAALGLCSPGGQEVADNCAAILGTEAGEVEYKAALVRCMGSYDNTSNKMNYDGLHSCSAAELLAGGVTTCRYGCMGLGDCEAVCEYGAISICNGVAKIDPEKCTGCSKCVRACPKDLIKFVPKKPQAVVRCSSCDRGPAVMKVCKIGCIGCKKCEKVCKYDAVTVKDFCAYIDAEKCTACGECVEACPRNVITMVDDV